MHHSTEVRQQVNQRFSGPVDYVPLNLETRTHVSTAAAAYYLNRRPQTLRVYALDGHPICPVRFNGRLAWPVSEIKRVLGVPV